jgi:hypothetical protein
MVCVAHGRGSLTCFTSTACASYSDTTRVSRLPRLLHCCCCLLVQRGVGAADTVVDGQVVGKDGRVCDTKSEQTAQTGDEQAMRDAAAPYTRQVSVAPHTRDHASRARLASVLAVTTGRQTDGDHDHRESERGERAWSRCADSRVGWLYVPPEHWAWGNACRPERLRMSTHCAD